MFDLPIIVQLAQHGIVGEVNDSVTFVVSLQCSGTIQKSGIFNV